MLGNGFLPMFAPGGAAANVWTGATWAVSGGNAYNTPTLGAELLTNGEMEGTYTAGIAPSWTALGTVIPTESADAYAGSKAQQVTGTDGSSTNGVSGSIGTIAAGSWIYAQAYIKKTTGTSARFYIGPSSIFSLLGTGIQTGSTYALIPASARCTTSGAGRVVLVGFGPTIAGIFDNVSAKVASTHSLFATVTGASSSQTAAAKIATLTTGIQSGVVALLDSASNSRNFLIAYHDGTGVTLDKCVNGVYTNLIPRVTVAFSANAPIEIRRPSGNTFQLWYNGVQRGTDQTVSDAGIINNARYGLFSTYSSGTFSEFSLGGVVIPFNLPGA